MAKHEPWFKPRDEDEDERLLEGFRRPPANNQSSGGGLGCPLTAAPAVGVVVALLAIRLKKGSK